MTIEQELMQYDEEQFAAEDAAGDAASTCNKYLEEAAALDASLFAPIKDVVRTTNTTNTNTVMETPIVTTTTGNYYENIPNKSTIITTVNTTGPLLTIIEEEPNQENITTTRSDTTACINKSPADEIHADTPIHTNTPNTTIKEAEDLEQHLRL